MSFGHFVDCRKQQSSAQSLLIGSVVTQERRGKLFLIRESEHQCYSGLETTDHATAYANATANVNAAVNGNANATAATTTAKANANSR